jgi:hypothetical protein
MVEFEAFNQAWDKKEAEYEEKSSQFEKELLVRIAIGGCFWGESAVPFLPITSSHSLPLLPPPPSTDSPPLC